MQNDKFKDHQSENIAVSEDSDDITRLKAQVALIISKLKHAKERLKIWDDIAEEGLLIHEDFIIREVNQALLRLTGYTKEDLIGGHAKILVSRKSFDRLKKHLQKGDSEVIELEMIAKDGDKVQTYTKGKTIKLGNRVQSAVIIQNITAHKKTQRELAESEEKHRLISRLLSDYVYICRIKPEHSPEIEWVSGAIENISGYSSEEIGQLEHGWFSIIHPDDLSKIEQTLEYNYVESKFYSNEYRVIDKKGIVRWVHDKSMCINVNSESKELTLLGATKDITERKRMEEDLRTRNHELNNFVYKVSHDIRAPLSSIKGLINLSKIENNYERHLSKIEGRVDHLDGFIRDILSHSRNLNTDVVIEKVNLQKMVKEWIKELEYMSVSTAIEKKISISGEDFFTDKTRLSEIVRNLISNAIKYHDASKKSRFIKITGKITKKKAKLVFEDNGIGISKKYLKEIFKMFYRATEEAEGSGIGLYIVKQSLENIGGNIKVKSKLRVGSRFKVEIPNLMVKKKKVR